MQQAVIDAIRGGDVAAVREYLDGLPQEDRRPGVDRAVAAEVARSGGPGFASMLYQYSPPAGPWDDIDPLMWAADHGASILVRSIVSNVPESPERLRGALTAAQAWLDVDLEAELRRRSGAAEDAPATVVRDHVTVDECEPSARRVRLHLPDGRWAEVLNEHRAVITVLEPLLHLPVTREELLARALWSPDPQSYTWAASQWAAKARFPAEETFAWALARIADEDAAVRHFAAGLLFILAAAEESDGADRDPSGTAAAQAVLRTRMATETDTGTLCEVLGAYTYLSGCDAGLPELLPFAADARPQVRQCVAVHLGTQAREDERQGTVLETLLRLAVDPDAVVRRSGGAALAFSAVDSPALREVLAAHLNGDDRAAQIEAAVGLALRGDATAMARLRRLSDEDGPDSVTWSKLDHVERAIQLGPARAPTGG